MPRANSRYKSTVHVLTSGRDHQTSNTYRRRRPDSELTNAPSSSSYNIVSYHRSQQQQPQLSSRSYHPISLSSRSITSSSLSNRRTSTVDVPSSSTYSSLITVNNRPTIPNSSSSSNQNDELTRGVSIQGKRYSTDSTNTNSDSTKVSNHLVIIPKSKSNSTLDKQHHISCPVAYQNQISLGTITILSDSSSDNTILHHLPDQNETTDKSQQSLHDERLHRSPRKANNNNNNNIIGSRVHSTSSIDEQKKQQIPSIHYTIEPIEVHEDLNDENHYDSKQKAIREEKKRKANENEQVLINVDEYASEILLYLKEREVKILLFIFVSRMIYSLSLSRLAYITTEGKLYA